MPSALFDCNSTSCTFFKASRIRRPNASDRYRQVQSVIEASLPASAGLVFPARPFHAGHSPLFTCHCPLLLSLLAVHRPQIINPRREALAHYFPAHAPCRINRHTGQAHRPPSPPAVYRVQHTHELFARRWLSRRKQVIRNFIPLAKIKQQHLGFAVAKTLPVHTPSAFLRRLCQQARVIRWVCQINKNTIGILCFVGG